MWFVLACSLVLFLSLAWAQCPTDKQFTCSPTTCEEYQFCGAGSAGSPPTTRICPAETPFCSIGANQDSCTKTRDPFNPACTAATSTFTCTSHGFFPDPFDCRTYHNCPKDLTQPPIDYVCEAGWYFDTKKKTCVHNTKYCPTVSCTEDGFKVYQPNAQYYVFCDGADIYMYRCPNNELYEVYQGCQYKCRKVGKFEHENKAKFYECNGSGVVGVVRDCPSNTEFDPSQGLCVYKVKLLLSKTASVRIK